MTGTLDRKRFFGRDIILPLLVFVGVIFAFLYAKDIFSDFSDNDKRNLTKFLFTVIAPLGLIHLIYKDRSDFGIYFPKFSDSFKLTLRAYAVGGPAGGSFMLIALLGWSFADWYGSITLTLVYLIVLYVTPKVTASLPNGEHIQTPNNGIFLFTLLSLLSVVVAYFTYEHVPIVSKIMYYMFLTGLGEELLFRGYMQSAFNRYFGKPFEIAGVKYGWGLILAAVFFGLIHSLVSVPPIWPWALFTFVLGLVFGYVREKDGSILSAVLLHGFFDMPLVFFSA